ncbi:MAG TPA: hypothetical protein VFE57_07580 [Cyclobacteriaceae bacterium]|jgi:hypothetical protein|nr:hypothetical protein [Cyclobacteriaceae bacterium]
MKSTPKVQCIHPEGKKAPAIAADTYALFEKAIYHSLKSKKKLSFTALTEEVEKYFLKQKTKFDGAIGWYTIHVKNHMEATGIVKTIMVDGKKIHSLA